MSFEDSRTDVMTRRPPPWAHFSVPEPKRVKAELDQETPLPSPPRPAIQHGASTEDLRQGKMEEHEASSEPRVARTLSDSAAEAEAEVERALLPACERTSLAEELYVTMKSNSRREPHDLFARTQIRTRSASLDAVSSSVNPNDVMSPLASPASPRGCRNGATSMDVEGALIQSIDTDTPHQGIPTAPLSSHTPRRSLSHEGAGTQPLSRSDSAHRVPRS